jgi:hypothetical protein
MTIRSVINTVKKSKMYTPIEYTILKCLDYNFFIIYLL